MDVTIRPFESSDYAAWRRAFASRLPAVRDADDAPIPIDELTDERYAAMLQRHRRWAADDRTHVLGVFSRASAVDVLGWVDLTTLARDELQWANLGFHVHSQHRGRGYGLAAVRAAVRHGFSALDYHRIEAAIRLDNAAAIRTVERAGLVREGIRRRFWRDPEGWTDHVVYAAIAA